MCLRKGGVLLTEKLLWGSSQWDGVGFRCGKRIHRQKRGYWAQPWEWILDYMAEEQDWVCSEWPLPCPSHLEREASESGSVCGFWRGFGLFLWCWSQVSYLFFHWAVFSWKALSIFQSFKMWERAGLTSSVHYPCWFSWINQLLKELFKLIVMSLCSLNPLRPKLG